LPGISATCCPAQALDVRAALYAKMKAYRRPWCRRCWSACRVTTHAGSIAELAIDGQTALVVKPQDVRSLQEKLSILLKDQDLRTKLGNAARRHCAEGFSCEKMLDRMEAVYRRVSGRYR
jgi:glycosyltransferase involved in cell wall biosynthesis